MATDESQWYVQKGARVQGPFSSAEISRFLILGRVRNTDRVSRDGELWEPVTQVPQLIPEELLDLETGPGWTRFLDVRAALDARGREWAVDPRAAADAVDRRDPERDMAARLRDEWRSARLHAKADAEDDGEGVGVDRRSGPGVQGPTASERSLAESLLPWSLLGLTLVALGIVLWLDSASLPSG